MSGQGSGARKDTGVRKGPRLGEGAASAPQERRAPGGGRAAAPAVEPAPTPAEQHLGDRLAALVDGELGHDARERVLAHLATCDECRQEADEQRRVKEMLSPGAAEPPGPPAGLLARLHALPGLDPEDDGGGDGDEGRQARGPRPLAADPYKELGLFARQGGSLLQPRELPGLERQGAGFRIHEVAARAARPSAHRGRRFAFAAAGAFSMAAVALGGALSVEEAPPGGEEPGGSVPSAVAAPGRGSSVAGGSATGGGSTNGLLLVHDTAGTPLAADVAVSLWPALRPSRLLPSSRPLPTATPPAAAVSSVQASLRPFAQPSAFRAPPASAGLPAASVAPPAVGPPPAAAQGYAPSGSASSGPSTLAAEPNQVP